MKVLIGGAGLGGLAAAACLMDAGHEVEVFERTGVLAEVGAGIQISPNAARVLRHIGVLDAVAAVAARPVEYRFRLFDSGAVLQSIPLGPSFEERHGVPYLTVHRADLMEILVEAVRRRDPAAVRLGQEVTGYTREADKVHLHLADRAVSGDVLIAADGVRSTIRAAMLGATPARHTGQAAWRVLLAREDVGEGTETVDIWVGPGRHAVTYPLRNGELVNFVGAVRHEAGEDESWTTARPWAELDADFSGWHRFVRQLIEAADRNACYRWALYDREPIETWTDGPVALMGDAAHPTLPYMAQGAAMALEDAAVLARTLPVAGDPAPALATYCNARVERTARIVRQSRENARLFQMPDEATLRAAFAGRNENADRNAWLFSYDPFRALEETRDRI